MWIDKGEVTELSANIRRIIDGRDIELRDNSEGAWSILKNDVHTLAALKNAQADSLRRECDLMADSLADISQQLKTPLTAMMIMAELAYSQLKINRTRTIWTLIGIALSSALITAVCGFAASINSMLKGLLGQDYGDYGGTAVTLLRIPVVVLSILIVLMSVVVISNAFRVSAGERMAQFGILKSAGATSGQISETVMYESLLLSAAGIPIGIFSGLLLAFIGVKATNLSLDEINALANVMMTEMSFDLKFAVSWQAVAAALILSFMIVIFSAWLPARIAARRTAIDSIRGSGEVRQREERLKTSPFIQRAFGFEGVMAAKNMKRSRRNFRAGLISLTVSIVLFITVASVSGQLGMMGELMFPDMNSTVTVDYTSAMYEPDSERGGMEGQECIAPISSELCETIKEKLEDYDDTAIFGMGMEVGCLGRRAIVPREKVTQEMLEAYFNNEFPDNPQSYETSVEIIVLDKENYKALCEKAGAPMDSNLLLNSYGHNDKGVMKTIKPYSFTGGNVRLIAEDGSESEIPVHEELLHDDIPKELLYFNAGIVRLVVPDGKMRYYDWHAAAEDADGFMEHAKDVMAEMFPLAQGEKTYGELGYTTRVFKTDDYIKIMNVVIVLLVVFVYCFAVLLTLIGITNVISNMSANVHMRAGEFAVLQSVGMTYGGLRRMLNLESIICCGKALAIGVPIAVLLGYLINIPIRTVFPIPYSFPLSAVLLCASAVFALAISTVSFSASRLKAQNIIETIRRN